MEKPPIPIGRGKNRIRYHYFFGNLYPIYVNLPYTFILSLLLTIPDWGGSFYLIQFPVFLILSSLLSLLIIKLFFTIENSLAIRSSLIVALCNILPLLIMVFYYTAQIELFVGFSFLTLLILIIFYKKVGRITIYPNRIVVKNAEDYTADFYGTGVDFSSSNKKSNYVYKFDELKRVRWGIGKIKTSIPSEYKDKIKIITPLHYEDEDDDCIIYFHYVYVELDIKVVHVLQPMVYRNHFSKNAKYGWLENWRWDGKLKLPPKDWEIQESKDF